MEVSTSFGFCFNNNLNSSAHPCTSPTMKRGSFVVTVMCLLDIGNAVAIIRARAPCGFKKKVERGGGGGVITRTSSYECTRVHYYVDLMKYSEQLRQCASIVWG